MPVKCAGMSVCLPKERLLLAIDQKDVCIHPHNGQRKADPAIPVMMLSHVKQPKPSLSVTEVPSTPNRLNTAAHLLVAL